VESIDAGTNTTGRPGAGGRLVPVGCEMPDPAVVLEAAGAARSDPLLHAPMATSAKTGK
jgi:hypothetical protein